MRLTNLTTRPQVLSDGVILAAAGTKGASKEVKELSDRDRKRLVARGRVHIHEATTSPRVASQAAKILQDESASEEMRSVAGSALSQVKKKETK